MPRDPATKSDFKFIVQSSEGAFGRFPFEKKTLKPETWNLKPETWNLTNLKISKKNHDLSYELKADTKNICFFVGVSQENE